MKIAFLHDGISFDGESLRQGPLGGTETAIIGTAAALAKLPDSEIYVFANVQQAKLVEQVHYLPLSDFGKKCQSLEWDSVVSIRQWLPLKLPFLARSRIYFSPDAWDQPFLHHALEIIVTVEGQEHRVGLFPPNQFFPDIDSIFCIGQWQADTFVEKLAFPKEKIKLTYYCHFPELFSPKELAERQPALVYSSTPFRGLQHLANYFPEIQQAVPSVQMEVCSGMGVYGVSAAADQQSFGELYKQLKTCGAEVYGSIAQSKLAEILCRSRVFAYPNTFEETFCIAVLEAQAAGLPVVTSNQGALKERVTHGVDGFLIDGHPSEEKYRKEFIKAVTELLTNDELWQRMSRSAREKSSNFTYDQLAKTLFKLLSDLNTGRPRGPKNDYYSLAGLVDSIFPIHGQNFHVQRATKLNFLKQSAQRYGF